MKPLPAMERPAQITDLFRLAKSKPRHLCAVRGCRNKRAGDGGRLCSAHRQLAWRLRNPTRAAFASLRDHAKGRKVEFSLTWEDFRRLSDATGYAANRGQTLGALAVDRIDFRRGYVPGNVRIVTVAENAAKGYVEGVLAARGWSSPWAEAGGAALDAGEVIGAIQDAGEDDFCPF